MKLRTRCTTSIVQRYDKKNNDKDAKPAKGKAMGNPWGIPTIDIRAVDI